jgi:cytoskeleton protein RodZ
MEHVEVETADGTTEIHPLDEPEDQAVVEAQVEAPLEPALAAANPAPTEVPPSAAITQSGTSAPQVPAAPSAVVPAEAADAVPATQIAMPVVNPPAQSPAPVVVETEAPAAPIAPAAGEALVNLQFTADCWTQLTDADGKVLLSALKRRGDSVELVGKAPLELRLGYARGAVVLVNGQSVDVASSTHGETARLKLGQ